MADPDLTLVKFPDVAYMRWAKALPPVAIDLARSGVAHCPRSLLAVRSRDIAIELPVRYGYVPLRAAIARRYRVEPDRVFTASGGTTLANWFACVTALDGSRAATEVIVERPTYEPLLRAVQALGCRVRRLERRFEEQYAIDLERFRSLVTRRTRAAIVTNLHNPSGARIPEDMLSDMARILDAVGAWLIVDEVYLDCLVREKPQSAVHAGRNVITTNSLTKAYGLDGLRAGWMLGPAPFVARAWSIHTLVAGNGVAPGERLALRAFERIHALRARTRRILEPNLETIVRFFERESRMTAVIPPGGTVVFPRLPAPLEGDSVATHLHRRYSTAVAPGSFFESPQHIRISFGCPQSLLTKGLANISRTLDDLHA